MRISLAFRTAGVARNLLLFGGWISKHSYAVDPCGGKLLHLTILICTKSCKTGGVRGPIIRSMAIR